MAIYFKNERGVIRAISRARFQKIFGVKYKAGMGQAPGHGVPAYIAKVDDEVGFGLFACRALKRGELIGEYSGTRTAAWARRIKKNSDFKPYLLHLPFDPEFAIDAAQEGNELRFINHSLKNPNIERAFLYYRGLMRVVFIAKRALAKHSQLLLNYGQRYWRRGAPRQLRE